MMANGWKTPQEIMVPVGVDTQEVKKIVKEAISESVKEWMDAMIKSSNLPLYPNQDEIKKELGIGQDTLNEWYAMGLKKQIWSSRKHRVERSELQRFLRENFEI